MQYSPEMKQQIKEMWNNNTYNVRGATDRAVNRSPAKMHVGIEIVNTIFTESGLQLHKNAMECLQFLSAHPSFNVFFSTIATDETVTYFQRQHFEPNKILIYAINQNYQARNASINPSKPFADIIIDSAAGFNPVIDWYWLHQLLRISEDMIRRKNQPSSGPNPTLPVAMPVAHRQEPITQSISSHLTDKKMQPTRILRRGEDF